MQTVSGTNVASSAIVGAAIAQRMLIKYPNDNFLGHRTGKNGNTIEVYLEDGESQTEASNMITAVGEPTCTHNNLTITVNFGTYVVNDQDTIVADPTNKKWVLVKLGIDDTTGDFEIFFCEKTTGEYGDLPAGKTYVHDLKEYYVEANGTELVEFIDFIEESHYGN